MDFRKKKTGSHRKWSFCDCLFLVFQLFAGEVQRLCRLQGGLKAGGIGDKDADLFLHRFFEIGFVKAHSVAEDHAGGAGKRCNG